MIGLNLFCIVILWHLSCARTIVTPDEYFSQRNDIILKDARHMIGNDLILSEEESKLNEILMREKLSEISKGYNESNYLPSKNFMLAKKEIEETKVFQIIKRLPKGASLHSHDSSSASVDWLVEELTYSDDLYMCRPGENRTIFKYQDSSNEDCDWQSVSDVRSKTGKVDFDNMLKRQMTIITDDPKGMYPNINDVWIKMEQAFESTISLISCNAEFFEKHLWRSLQEQVDDGVNYLEYRSILDTIVSGSGEIELSVEDVIKLSSDIVNKFTEENKDRFHGAKLIYAQNRGLSNDVVKEGLEQFALLNRKFPEFVVGYDLVGQEDLGKPLKFFANTFLSHPGSLKLVFHAGETKWKGLDSDENLLDALLLNTTRIGHGFAITKHPEFMRLARKKDIPLEVCPISHQVLNLVSDLRNHPAAILVAENFPLVVSADGYQMWGASPMSHDFYEAFHALGGAKADLRFLKQLILNSIRYSFLNSTEQETLTSIWKRIWDQSISELINEFS